MKKLIAVATIAMAGLSVGGSVFAGEVGGSTNGKANGPKATEGHAQSICAFSGLADGGEGEPSGPGTCRTGDTSIAASSRHRGSPATATTGSCRSPEIRRKEAPARDAGAFFAWSLM